MIEYDANRELCDGGPRFDATTIAQHCQPTNDENDDDADDATTTTVVTSESTRAPSAMVDANNDATLAKRTLKLELGQQGVEKGSLDNEDDEKKAASATPELLSPGSNLSKCFFFI